MSNKNKWASHIEARAELQNMQNLGGAMIQPFILNKIFSLFLPKEERAIEKNERIIRDSVYTYCALCNEFFVLNRHAKYPKKEFFISAGRWEKYHISNATIERSIEFLTKRELIACEIKDVLENGNSVRVYKINLDLLITLRKAAQEIIEGAII